MHKRKNRRLIIWIIIVLYLAVLLKITVFRQGFLQYPLFSHGAVHVPFQCLAEALGQGKYLYFLYLVGGNIAWFVPIGFLLPYQTDKLRKLPVILLFGFLLSFIIELSQFVFGTGESELDDLILNTTGTMIGYMLFTIYSKHKDAKNVRERN